MVPLDPTGPFGSAVGGAAVKAWAVAMLGLWNAGLWLLRIVLQLVDGLLTPDLSEHGPAGAAYRVTFWLAAGLVVIMLVAQLGTAVLRRDGRALATALWGCAKFVVVWATWVTYGAAVVSASGGLTRALLRSLLHVDRWADWRPDLGLSAEQVTDATIATVLGLLGLLLWLAALAHLVIMMGRGAALLVLAATTPVAAAGLVGEAGRAWFWRSVRWFHAAAFTPVLTALLLGVGVQITTGAAQGLAAGPARAIGTALPGVMLVLISAMAPLALFHLLAFVDPATPAGVTLRQTLDAVHDLRSLGQLRPPSGGDPSSPDAPPPPAADAEPVSRFTEAEDALAGADTPTRPTAAQRPSQAAPADATGWGDVPAAASAATPPLTGGGSSDEAQQTGDVPTPEGRGSTGLPGPDALPTPHPGPPPPAVGPESVQGGTGVPAAGAAAAGEAAATVPVVPL